MKLKFLQLLGLTAFIFYWQLAIFAEYPDYENVYVNDWANLLDTDTEDQITRDIKSLRVDSDVEITLVTINRMSDYPDTKQSIEGFALDLFNKWGVGNAQKNDGVLVLVSRFDRKMRIATGRAYDGTKMNDVAKNIIDNYFIPYFKRDDYQKGIAVGMEQVVFEFNPSASTGLGFLSSVKQNINNTSSQAWYELIHSEALIFIGFFVFIFLSIGLKSLKQRFFSSTEQQAYYSRPNYLVDKQPKKFKQVFSDTKELNKTHFSVVAIIGGFLITFFSFFVGFNFWKFSFTLFIAGVGIAYLIAKFILNKRNAPKDCPKCSSIMDRLSEALDDKHLQLAEKVEESLKSVDYDVWMCGSCERTKKLAYPYWFSSIKQCQQCEYKTLEIDVNTLKTATTSRKGLEEVIQDCKYCDFHHEYERVIPKKSESSSSSGGGGSFGGGSSSGGGASGSW